MPSEVTLHRTLSLRDVTLLGVACIVGTRWLATAAHAGPGSVTLFLLAGIFFVVQQVDGLFITPKIVGDRVGLHPVTVIFSVFLWSLLLGGLLGAILAVPMTATCKVILKRYVWERSLLGDTVPVEAPVVSDK